MSHWTQTEPPPGRDEFRAANALALLDEAEAKCERQRLELVKLNQRCAALTKQRDALRSAVQDAPHPGGADGTDRLCRAVYGRGAQARDYIGGSEARMLHAGADRIAALEAEVERLRAAVAGWIRLLAEAAEEGASLRQVKAPELARGGWVSDGDTLRLGEAVLADLADLKADNAALRQTVRGMADRITSQSDALARAAERGREGPAEAMLRELLAALAHNGIDGSGGRQGPMSDAVRKAQALLEGKGADRG